MDIGAVCRKFNISGSMVKIDIIKTGNINKTYKVTFKNGGNDTEYIVQSINTNVFKKPDKIMSNVDRVTSHIAAKLTDSDGRDVLSFLKTDNGKNYFIDEEGNFWRSYFYIPNSVTYDVFDDTDILRRAGAAFGKFQMQLTDFDGQSLYEIIPDFHNTARRYRTFCECIGVDEYGRVKYARDEIAYLLSAREIGESLSEMQAAGQLPLRVTHNDTKCNNILFDVDTGETLAVIDLDTVMPGLVAYDFGDAVRFAANSSREDEPNTSLTGLDLEKFEAFASGFMSSVSHSLTQKEIDTMYLGPIVMALELAVRFLTDYIDGDKYFKTDYPGHNLVRTRCQIALAKDMIKKIPQMREIIGKYSK